MTYQLHYPTLRCEDCRAYFAAGELRALPCRLCPDARFPPLDAVSLQTLEVHQLAIALSPEMGAPPLDFVFRLLGLRVPSATAREVAMRLALLWQLQREHRTQQAQRAAKQRPASLGEGQADQRGGTQT